MLSENELAEMFNDKPEEKKFELQVTSNGDLVANRFLVEEIENMRQFQITLQEMKNEEEEMKEAIARAFVEAGIEPHTVSIAGAQFVYKKGSTRTSIDTKRLKAEKPDVAEQYTKVSVVSPSWSIKYDD